MKPESYDSLNLATNLIALERGKEELLLVSGDHLRPVYFADGREYIKKFLAAIKELGGRIPLQEAFPHDRPLLDMLLAHGIVSEGDADNSPIRDAAFRWSKGQQSGLTLYLLLSQSCNMGCVYCLNGIKSYQKNDRLMMPEEVAYRSLDRVFSLVDPGGTLKIILFGGEPLLNWPLGRKAILYCESLKPRYKEVNIEYYITSNFSLLPSDLIYFVKEYRIGLLCDLDGPAPIHNRCRPFRNGRPSYDRIVRNVRTILDSGWPIQLRSTITAFNQDLMVDIARHHREIGADSISFVPVIPVNSDEEFVPETLLPSPSKLMQGLDEVFHNHIIDYESIFPFTTFTQHVAPMTWGVVGCGTPYGTTPVVDVRGDVYPCIYMMGIKRYFMGNVMDGSFPDLEGCRRMLDLIHVDLNDECRGCRWRYLCGGGCPVLRLTVLENPKASENVVNYCRAIYCDYSRKILELLLWRKAEEAVVRLGKEHPEAAGVSRPQAPVC